MTIVIVVVVAEKWKNDQFICIVTKGKKNWKDEEKVFSTQKKVNLIADSEQKN